MVISKRQMNVIIGILVVCIALIFVAGVNSTHSNTVATHDKIPNTTMASPVTTPHFPDSTSSPDVAQTSSYTNAPISSITPELTEEQKNIKICEQVAANYSSTHIYTLDDRYVCGNMAQDVWDLLKAKGINAKIMVGNVNKDISNENRSSALNDCNHAWVAAEVSPNSWLAIECTGGYVVYESDNSLYYKGFKFSSPKNYQSYMDLYRDWNYQYQDYINYSLYYNELVAKYNNANYNEQQNLISGLVVAKQTLDEKQQTFLETDTKLATLINYG